MNAEAQWASADRKLEWAEREERESEGAWEVLGIPNFTVNP